MAEPMKHLTTRVPASLLDALDDQAKQRRMKTGENVNRADLVREALEAVANPNPKPRRKAPAAAPVPKPSLLSQATNCPDKQESIALALEIIAQLAEDAGQRGLLMGVPQEIGMAVTKACKRRQDVELLLDYVSKIHGALRAV